MTTPRLHVLHRAPREMALWRVARWTALAVLAMLLVALVRAPAVALTALWYVAVPGAMSILGITSGIGWLAAAIYGVLGLDALVQLFDQKGRSLHDHLFGTRVVYAFAEPAREGAAP